MAEVTITVGGVEHRVRLPLGLDVLEDAGDAIDRVQALLPELAPYIDEQRPPPMRLLARAARAAMEAFCIAINADSPGAVDFEAVSRKSTLADATPLIAAMSAALTGSGFAAKEADQGELGGRRQSASASPSKRKSAASSRA